MLEVDYTVERAEGANSKQIFHPHPLLRKIDGNIIMLEAPNASGKSFLLNAIALGLFGDRLLEGESHISPSLREKIKKLAARDDEKFTFDIKITNSEGTLSLRSKKENPSSKDIRVEEIIATESGPTSISYTTLKQNYYFIYDIPESPIKRLPQLVEEIKLEQVRYRNRVSALKEQLEHIMKQIRNSRDPVKIQEIEQQISTFITQKSDQVSKKDASSNKLDVLEKYHIFKQYSYYYYLYDTKIQMLKKEQGKEKRTKTTQRRKSTIYKNEFSDMKSKITDLDKDIQRLGKIFNNILDGTTDGEQIKKWVSIDPFLALEKFEFDCNLKKQLKYFKVEVDTILNDQNLIESGRMATFFKELLTFLNHSGFKEIVMPGTGKKIESILQSIQEEYDKNKELEQIYSQARESKELIRKIEENIEKYSTDLSTLKLLYKRKESALAEKVDVEDVTSRVFELESSIGSLEKTLRKYENMAYNKKIDVTKMEPGEFDRNLNEIRKNNHSLNKYFILSEDELESNIQRIANEIQDQNGKIADLDKTINDFNNRLEDLNSRKPHEYQQYYHKIDTLHELIEMLERKLIKYDKYIELMKSHKRPEDGEEYCKLVSEYLASKIPACPYINDLIYPEAVDIINEKIIANNGERSIKFDDISTGQGMSIYLRTLLKRPADDSRKVIAIFDEVSTMDQTSLQPIIETLRNLDSSGRLLFAIFVQKGEHTFKISNLT
ncbi:hypothetical protein [uncultured Methanomethylovorans sp.]|uniref:hypothetical protein n=1 Tax=uncultured Methanomethylovorans sp. TaxID=183759 RepID=UPI002AA6F42B|nr:hypothetical protein [uncultured Methanomethylovorans sp.]